MPVPLRERRLENVIGRDAKSLPFTTVQEFVDFTGDFASFRGVGAVKAAALDEARDELRGAL
jgi:hypothetical protein